MKYPSDIVIQGYNYELKFVPNARDVNPDDPDSELNGLCGDTDLCVNTNQTPLGILDTVIHETLHAIFNRSPMLTAALRTKSMEEPFITTLATAVANVLVNNKLVDLGKT